MSLPCHYQIVSHSGAIAINEIAGFDKSALLAALAGVGIVVRAEEPVLASVAPAQTISRLVTNCGDLMLSQEFEGMGEGVLIYSEDQPMPEAIYAALQASPAFVALDGPRA
ncbi:hypothetical protein DEO45_05685 [Rhodanobacter denitrificans]|uniref:Uncharacterized protein n=1 Tax=Rhodanobacter denitrificans TaxID=666685 RepID=A0A368KER6_9GAMM|nr:hypothetical protein [Rhodanobacter denitrificans]RCS30327.1 hypothetical protein DEO45_05685 [Rhodanobacter denitrificans]